MAERWGFMRSNTWMSLAWESWSLGIEASAVVALRLAKIAGGTPAAQAEVRRMIAEKIEAAAQLQWRAMTGALGVAPAGVARKSVAHYRKAVARNRRRLAGRG